MQKRYRNVNARPLGFTMVCPYKDCRILIEAGESLRKGDLIKCENCGNKVKVRSLG